MLRLFRLYALNVSRAVIGLGVAEDPQRGAVARGARQGSPYVPKAVWK
ncbi:MAG: hypothetical protein LBB47_07035 [Spirochaetaceae bacterium]|nr:hypothetical protein [Spirochaetaceae bacterium]